MNAHDLLLREARSARDSLAELQEATENKRLDYYQAVRRLHSSGAPMRNIGEALGLSHQRVHQIVNGGGQMAHPTPARKLLQRMVGRREGKCEAGHVSREPGEDMFDRFHVEARAAMSGAQDEARAFYHHYIGTEHILLGLLRTEQSLAAQLLFTLGLDLAKTRRAVEVLVGRGEGAAPHRLPVTPRVKKALELAQQETKSVRGTHVRSEHLLLGLAREGAGLAARIMAEHGVGYDQLRKRVRRAKDACSFCGKSGLDVAHLVAGPGVFICEHCTQDASEVAGQAEVRAPQARLRVVAGDGPAACSFCGKQRPDANRLIAGSDALICTDCLRICREVQEEESTTFGSERD